MTTLEISWVSSYKPIGIAWLNSDPTPLKEAQPSCVFEESYAHIVAVKGPSSSAMIWKPRPLCGLLNATVMGPLPTQVPFTSCPPSQRISAPGLKLPTQPQLNPGHSVRYCRGRFAVLVRVTFNPGKPETGSTVPEA